jgi:hypothetical protein
MTGIERIAKERKRQVGKERWTKAHDDGHVNDELARAAACYALAYEEEKRLPVDWPWERESWKPCSRVRNLEKAGALIAAEIDRLLRLEEE